jgi:hypothetical protein
VKNEKSGSAERSGRLTDSGVVEGDAGGWHPQIIKCQGGCYSCSIPPNQVSCYQFTITRQFATTRPPDLTGCKMRESE